MPGPHSPANVRVRTRRWSTPTGSSCAWRVSPVRVIDNHREPNLTLRERAQAGGGRPGYSATVGCNQLGGTYDVKGNALTFGAGMSTLMACAPPLGDMERRLAETLSNTRRWQVTGPTLELSDENGQSLALLEAVYLK